MNNWPFVLTFLEPFQIPKEQLAFENWLKNARDLAVDFELDKDKHGNYISPLINRAWQGWLSIAEYVLVSNKDNIELLYKERGVSGFA